jgi:hypothetical protein
MTNPFAIGTLKCQCVLTNSLPIVEKCITKLVNTAPADYKQQIHQLEILIYHLKESAQQHVKFKSDYAHAYWEQHKRESVDPPDEKLQVMPLKTGKKLKEEREQEAERRRVAIETGRLKKRSALDDTAYPKKKCFKKRSMANI